MDHQMLGRGFLSNMFPPPAEASPPVATPVTGEITSAYQPSNGNFFRTLEYPQTDVNGQVAGKVWMEAGFDAHMKSWVLWQKSIRKADDILNGDAANIMNAKVLFEKTNFVNAYDQMTTFAAAKQSLGVAPLLNKTPAKLGGDYFKQFAWREGLMMSRSGRLYPMSEDDISANNFFDQQDIIDAKAFHERLKAEQFVPVPIVLPTTDWAKSYAACKTSTDERLNVLYYRYGNDKNSHGLALQIVGQEAPEVLYAHIQRGFSPRIFEDNPAQNFALVKAAIDRPSVDSLTLLANAGVSFSIRSNDETPVELALQQRRYSHLYTMLSRDGGKLANYTDESGNTPATMTIALQDRQAFHMLYLEELDYSLVDKNGMALVHHAFEHSFVPGVYAWLDEGMSIDVPIRNTSFTGLSIARRKNDQPMIDFALQHGADKTAPDFPDPAAQAILPGSATPALLFALDLLNSTTTNAEIEAAAKAHEAAGGNFTMLNSKGQSLFEICWKNSKTNPEMDRRKLIPVFGAIGADPASLLDDGTTLLTRMTSGSTLDMEFLKALSPYVRDVNITNANGNNLLHTLQINANEAVSHSNNVAAILKLFPSLDLNRQNNDGYSNIGLAIRLNRSQTLKNFPPASIPAVEWSQVTAGGGWSVLDLAFTAAAGLEKVTGAPRADKIAVTSDATRAVVLDMLDRTAKAGTAEQKQRLGASFNHQRPDGKTLAGALAGENAPIQIVSRLRSIGMTETPGPKI